MAVQFYSGSSNNYIRWTDPTNALGHTSKTICAWVRRASGSISTTSERACVARIDGGTNVADADEYNNLYIYSEGGGGGDVRYLSKFSTTSGVWSISAVSLIGSSWAHIAITHNASSTANDPVFYLNATSKTVTEITTPSGTYRSGTASPVYFYAGYVGTNSGNMVFELEDVRVYNVIKTAAEISAIYNEDIRTAQTIDETGLKFHAPLTMCKNLTYSTFDNAALTASNEFYDRMNGYTGAPTVGGSYPIGITP